MTQVIDMSVVDELLELCDDGDSELLVDLIEMFLNDGPMRVQGVVSGTAAGDFEEVERAAHSLKGSAGNLGALDVQNTSEALQVAARNADTSAIQRLAPELEQHFHEAELALKQLLAAHN